MLLQALVASYVFYVMVSAAFGDRKLYKNIEVIKQYRPTHLLTSTMLLAVVISVSTWLNHYSFLQINPIKWVFSKLFGGSSSGGGNWVLTGTSWKPYAIVLLAVFFLAVPTLARAEEEMFREGTYDWVGIVIKSIGFGLVHLIMLIPLGTAIAIIFAGLWFMYQYFKGGVERSTLHHSAYNSTIILLLLVFVVVG